MTGLIHITWSSPKKWSSRSSWRIVKSTFVNFEAVLIVTGNFLTIGLFATERKLQKKSLFLVVNTALADLISGAVSLPLYVYLIYRAQLSAMETSYKALEIARDRLGRHRYNPIAGIINLCCF